MGVAARSVMRILESTKLRTRWYGHNTVLKECGFHSMSNSGAMPDYGIPKITFDKTIEISDRERERGIRILLYPATTLFSVALVVNALNQHVYQHKY